MAIYLPLLVAVIGALIYALAPPAKAAELGRIAYAAGLLVTLFRFAGKMLG